MQWCKTNSVNPNVNLQDFLALTDNCWQSTLRTVGMEMKHTSMCIVPAQCLESCNYRIIFTTVATKNNCQYETSWQDGRMRVHKAYIKTYSLLRSLEILKVLIRLHFSSKRLRYWKLKFSVSWFCFIFIWYWKTLKVIRGTWRGRNVLCKVISQKCDKFIKPFEKYFGFTSIQLYVTFKERDFASFSRFYVNEKSSTSSWQFKKIASLLFWCIGKAVCCIVFQRCSRKKISDWFDCSKGNPPKVG